MSLFRFINKITKNKLNVGSGLSDKEIMVREIINLSNSNYKSVDLTYRDLANSITYTKRELSNSPTLNISQYLIDYLAKYSEWYLYEEVIRQMYYEDLKNGDTWFYAQLNELYGQAIMDLRYGEKFKHWFLRWTRYYMSLVNANKTNDYGLFNRLVKYEMQDIENEIHSEKKQEERLILKEFNLI